MSLVLEGKNLKFVQDKLADGMPRSIRETVKLAREIVDEMTDASTTLDVKMNFGIVLGFITSRASDADDFICRLRQYLRGLSNSKKIKK